MKILKLPAYYSPEQVASSHLTKDLNEALVQAGFQIENHVPSPTRGVSDEVRAEYKKLRYEEQADGKIIIHRFSLFREGKNPIQRATRYVLCNLIQYWRGIHAKNVDLIFGASTPPTQGMLCGLVKRCLKVPFVYNLQDIFPDSLVNAKMTKRDSLIWKIGRKIEDYSYRSADKIIVISEDFKRNIMEKGVPEEKIVIIPNWVNTEHVHPVDRNNNVLCDRYGLDKDKFYICYSGNVGHSQNLRLLLDTAKAIQTDLPDIRFVIIGEGAAKEELVEQISKESIENVTLLPFQPYEEISHVFSLGDVGLIISKPDIGSSSVPSKTWSIMAAERPVLASFDKGSQLAKLIDQLQIGVTAQAGDMEALIQAIRLLYEDREKANAMGKAGRIYVSDVIAKDKCVGQYVQLMESLVK